jgi:hypothetical protein
MSSRLNTWLLAAVNGALVIAVVWLTPVTITTTVKLGTCYWGDPVVVFDGRELPVAGWPDGMSYDGKRDALVDPAGVVLFRKGDVVTIEGHPVEVHGDPSPCFVTRGIRIESLVGSSSPPVAKPS